nr:PREDICTED: CD276 antigen homolog isoform X1 [Lepisosteus oculatus]XP_015197974.1 PREDICTED: CD276 antigen homolog isoform X1 [Lepisosteus oculatus]
MLLWTLTVYMLLCRVSLKTQADVRVVVPKSSVTGPYQNSVTLLCIFSSNGSVPIGNVSVRWEKQPNITVFAYENGQEQPDIENPAYRNRTSLFSDVTVGSASIVLVDLSLCDAGTYTCRVGSPDRGYGEGQLTLSVAAKPLSYSFRFNDYESLSFHSSGWYPKPVVFWTDELNRNITVHINITERTDGLFEIRSILYFHTEYTQKKIYIVCRNPFTGEQEINIFQQTDKGPPQRPQYTSYAVGGAVAAGGMFVLLLIAGLYKKLRHHRPRQGPGAGGANDYEPLDVNYQHEPTDSSGAAGADDDEPLIRGNRRRDSIDTPRINM